MHSSSSACQWGAAFAGGTLPNSKLGLYGILAFRFFLNVAFLQLSWAREPHDLEGRTGGQV